MYAFGRNVNEDRCSGTCTLDGVLVNELLVQEGCAAATPQDPYVKFKARLLQAQQEARSKGRGHEVVGFVVLLGNLV
jgi:endonuclease YncB( thermonuclease family)